MTWSTCRCSAAAASPARRTRPPRKCAEAPITSPPLAPATAPRARSASSSSRRKASSERFSPDSVAKAAVSTTRLFPLALMLALALLTLWLDHQVRVEGSEHPSYRRHDPDYMVMNFTTTTYSQDGHAETTLSAAELQHYPDDDSTELTSPRVVQA